jgi:hypothetical protein
MPACWLQVLAQAGVALAVFHPVQLEIAAAAATRAGSGPGLKGSTAACVLLLGYCTREGFLRGCPARG